MKCLGHVIFEVAHSKNHEVTNHSTFDPSLHQPPKQKRPKEKKLLLLLVSSFAMNAALEKTKALFTQKTIFNRKHEQQEQPLTIHSLRRQLFRPPPSLLETTLAVLAPPPTPLPQRADPNSASHLIVILGTAPTPEGNPTPALQSRITAASIFAKRFPLAILVPTGGRVATLFAEADVIRDALIADGIQSNRIFVETDAVSTVDNGVRVLRCFEAIEALHGSKISRITVVTEPFHSMRSLRIFVAALKMSGYPTIEVGMFAGVNVEREEVDRLVDGGFQPAFGARLGVKEFTNLERCIWEKRLVITGN